MNRIVTPLKYAIEETRGHWNDPRWWRKRFENRVIGTIQRRRYDCGIDIMEADWDILIVLDACRADYFEEIVGTDFDDYRREKSRASATMEWMQANFEDGVFGDTVYVSANPWVTKIAPDAFHHIENLWLDRDYLTAKELEEINSLGEAGIDYKETITAAETTEAALRVAEEYPDKRIIVHYLQPHAPYIGMEGGELLGYVPDEDPSDAGHSELRRRTVVNLYRANLGYAWHHAERVIDEVQGKTVVTSDHGEMFGEFHWPWPIRGYDHPIGLRTHELVTVPWAVIEDERRPVVDHGPRRHSVTADEQDKLTDRLRDLGYADPA